jgi:hypothetical protein
MNNVSPRMAHHAVDDERRRFGFLGRLRGTARLEHPLQLEVLDVGRRDLRQQRVAMAEQAARIRQPVVRFFVRAQEPVEGHLRVDRRGGQRGEQRARSEAFRCHGR